MRHLHKPCHREEHSYTCKGYHIIFGCAERYTRYSTQRENHEWALNPNSDSDCTPPSLPCANYPISKRSGGSSLARYRAVQHFTTRAFIRCEGIRKSLLLCQKQCHILSREVNNVKRRNERLYARLRPFALRYNGYAEPSVWTL